MDTKAFYCGILMSKTHQQGTKRQVKKSTLLETIYKKENYKEKMVSLVSKK